MRTLDEGRLMLEGTREGSSGNLMIASAPAVGTYVLPKLLEAFCNGREGIDVSVRTGHSPEVLRMVLEDEVQVGFGRPISHPEVATHILYRDGLVLVVSSSHRYAKRGAVHIDDLADEPLILFDRDSGFYSMTMNTFRELGVTPHQKMQLDSIEASKKMVEANLGIALLPAMSVNREIRMGLLKKVHIDTVKPVERTIAVMFRRNKPQSGPMAAFLQLLSDIYHVPLAG
jgi:DNA-binding transcriptional LysR family regulator